MTFKRFVNAKEFSEMTGFPLCVVRRLCRQGVIPCWNFRTRYLMDPDEAYKVLLALQGPDNEELFVGKVSSACKSVDKVDVIIRLPERSARVRNNKYYSYCDSLLTGS